MKFFWGQRGRFLTEQNLDFLNDNGYDGKTSPMEGGNPMFRLKVDEETKRCEIWVPFEGKECYRESEDYENSVRDYQNRGFSIVVFVGGRKPLLPAVAELLEAQKCKNKEVAS